MKIAIITHVPHIKRGNIYFGYAPYIREMNIWIKYTDAVIVVAPLVEKEIGAIEEVYQHKKVNVLQVPVFDITTISNVFKTIRNLPTIVLKMHKAMKQADHIHLRCPGNMGLIGAIVQIAFPKKKKTAKYAGNWDPKSKQPWSYRLQKAILSNTFLTRNMQVLVYGKWPNQTKNIKSFFTATYAEREILNSEFRIQSSEFQNEIKFIFVGTLSKGKQPLYAIQLIEQLHLLGKKVRLDLYGEGVLRKELESYITDKHLNKSIILKGNQTKEVIKQAYQNSHFLVLPSKSEGWPKVVAEAMFWGCVPLISPVSCVPYMVENGKRGVLLTENLEKDVNTIEALLLNKAAYLEMAELGKNWSREYTIDKFEEEIKKLLIP
jgi:glycosyltransferase involved in cell wall biosynthesis